ncbi:hypothetical protein HanRHA438_Chr06g0252771 [Helianthus annuus]|uniref:uncharacterized protein LOC110864597 isoform X4 n=1 Tax=Helianthus annuus TaxID=4232 RepID=UPI00165301C9|nr:uncharacterized protein LOC110864597 isoform X4 [Helianthus annuus]KAJ0910481.1 hypothetical protein HanRHA438_Chr06g0252771 [Helianthus annuus]
MFFHHTPHTLVCACRSNREWQEGLDKEVGDRPPGHGGADEIHGSRRHAGDGKRRRQKVFRRPLLRRNTSTPLKTSLLNLNPTSDFRFKQLWWQIHVRQPGFTSSTRTAAGATPSEKGGGCGGGYTVQLRSDLVEQVRSTFSQQQLMDWFRVRIRFGFRGTVGPGQLNSMSGQPNQQRSNCQLWSNGQSQSRLGQLRTWNVIVAR